MDEESSSTPGDYSFDPAHLWRHVFERSPQAKVVVEGEPHIVRHANAAFLRLAGANQPEVIGRPFARVVRRGDANSCMALLDRVLRTGTSESLTEQKHGEAPPVYWSYNVSPVLGSDERPVGLVIQVTDSTEIANFRRQAVAMNESLLLSAIRQQELVETAEALNARLQAELRAKDHFLAVLSHELRNPLAPIRNSIYLLERAAPASQQATRAKDVIRRQTEHLTRLVDDLLDATRISRGKVDLRRGRIDLRELVRKTTDDMASLFDLSEVELRVEHAAGPVWVDADATRIAQVVGNLLQNAVKFTPSRGAVVVGVATKEGRAEIYVRDTGIGMVADQVEGMFEPFAQADHGLARTMGGLGLGLALAKGLVELHGGALRGRSDGLGRGSEFIVTLPLFTGEAAAPEETDDVPAARGRLVLIIEDNVDAGHSLADILELYGHRVHVARDGQSGIELARELRPDVIVCDIGLPDVDGYTVARTLRADEGLRSTRLIALSGYAQPEDRQRAREAGFDVHIAKPTVVDELTKAIAIDG